MKKNVRYHSNLINQLEKYYPDCFHLKAQERSYPELKLKLEHTIEANIKRNQITEAIKILYVVWKSPPENPEWVKRRN